MLQSFYLGGPQGLDKLRSIASIETIFLAIFVLINQKRMSAVERKNADLHLQMSLLGEHEVTKLAQLVELIKINSELGQKTSI